MSEEKDGKTEDRNELDELERQIRRVIDDNKKFLERVMDEEFEPDEEPEEEEEEITEEL